MSEFKKFRSAIQKQFAKMSKSGVLFISKAAKDVVWDTYLNSFEEGTNLLYRERTEHDCQCCKHFVRQIGRVMGEIDGELVSLWDVNVGGIYQPVADALSALNKDSEIGGVFYHDEREVGKSESFEHLENGGIHVWDHFHQVIPKEFYKPKSHGELKGAAYTNCKVLRRSLNDISVAALEVVDELISQDLLYRGTEHKSTISLISKLKKELLGAKNKDLYLWTKAVELGGVCALRNTVIGTLLVDLSNGIELEVAVKKFEDKVAPHNYKRSKALVTPQMKENAKKRAKELGIEPSLLRRYATKGDVSVNNVLFADQTIVPFMEDSLFDMVDTVRKHNVKDSLKNVQEVSVDHFVKNILPKADSLELLLENKHQTNLMSLVAPVHECAPCIMKWGNNFSWSYNGDVTDSPLREKVRAAGGRVDGVFRFSHSWNHDGMNQSLMDLHVFMPKCGYNGSDGTHEIHDNYPTGQRVGWNNRNDYRSGGVQDVDFTERAGTKVPVENITFPELSKMPEGDYYCMIHNWALREPTKSGFKAEIEFGGEIFEYEYRPALKNKEWVPVAKVTLKNGEFTIHHFLPCNSSPKKVWGLQTQEFHKVDMVLNSPNHWDGNEIGNKHLFFILEECKNPEGVRGFYNEYLIDDLYKDRKVFEVLAGALKAPYNDNQLSGVGFSSTLRNDLTLRVKGSFNRVIKIKF